MKVGVMGLGKLGWPVASVLSERHDVIGYDPCDVSAPPESGLVPFPRGPLGALADSDVIVMVVQTPHASEYGGERPMPERPRAFNTGFLQAAVEQAPGTCPLVIVSTVLPGTCRERIEPRLAGRPYAYAPLFAAMGTVVEDLHAPEFVLAGARDAEGHALVSHLWGPVVTNSPPFFAVAVESAELAKVTYNTWISMKVTLTNLIGECAAKVGADPSEVAAVHQSATKRLVAPAYMTPGMGDGGPCHPRDNIAMSALAGEIGLSADPFTFVTRAREAHSEWLADRIAAHGMPVVLVGKAYKEGVALPDGSASLLLAHHLSERGIAVEWIDPTCGHPAPEPMPVACYVRCLPIPFDPPEGSVVVEP